MQHLNGSGTYDTLYPKTLSTNTIISDATATEIGLSSGATVDQALSMLQSKTLQFSSGTYTATCEEDKSATQFISLGFTPKVVLVNVNIVSNAYAMSDASYIYVATTDSPARFYGQNVLEITTNGFNVISAYRGVNGSTYTVGLNTKGQNLQYRYVAIG